MQPESKSKLTAKRHIQYSGFIYPAVDVLINRQDHKYLKLKEACLYANVSYNKLREFISRGDIKVSVVGGISRISKDEIDKFYASYLN